MRRSFCVTGLLPWTIDSLWLEKLGSIPGMSAAVHAKRSEFILRNRVSLFFKSSGRSFAIMVICSELFPIWIGWRSPSGLGLSWAFLAGGS
ncbi:hypothetical protein PIB30_115241, partial [Stylosanthes scabra]|nr:hypothetical protein [Stylosanthes scabra]